MSLDAAIVVRRDRFTLDIGLRIASGEVVAVLGPSGAGKTTLLRAIAGLARLSAGRIAIDGVVYEDTATGTWIPPERRCLGVVFQDALLFPHLSVLDNIASGLRFTGVSRMVARKRAREWLARLGLEALADARPASLSGGQAQRIALARALAPKPRLLLLDEPLSALDVATRAEVRRELRRQLASFGGIRLIVTHDPIDALALADRLVVVEAGRVVQAGAPLEVTARPRSRYVADFVGVNWFCGRAHGDVVTLDAGAALTVPDAEAGEVFVVVHPRAVALHRAKPEGSPRNVLASTVVAVDDEGTRVRVHLAVPFPLVAEVTRTAAAELELDRGGALWVTVKATEITTYPA
ncbi:MAG: ABC transporter ATP-binding protein [Deltaproteobacteria bacterium]|nr:ABC transporter ATP-binding protein [Deltaproteobacteria bacterium]